MNFRGKPIDPVKLWGYYCDLRDEKGPFLDLTMCPNPSHSNSRSPAFQINIDRPTVHCFSGCGISGSYEHAVCLIEGIYDKLKVMDQDLDRYRIPFQPGESPEIRKSRLLVKRAYREARKHIYKISIAKGGVASETRQREAKRKRSNVKVEARKAGAEAVASAIDLDDYSYLPKDAIKYLEKRGINVDSRIRWELGFDAEQERITIPVRDRRGRLQFVIRRAIKEGQKPAYLYPPECSKSSLLFGLDKLDRAMVSSNGLAIVEGSLDTIWMHQHGYRNTVGLLGSTVSEAQCILITQLNPPSLWPFLDKDAAGVWGIERIISMLFNYPIRVPLYPKGAHLDPNSLMPGQIEEAFRKAISGFKFKTKLKKARS